MPLSKKSGLERWESGLIHQFAKLATPIWGSEGSNPSLSATISILMDYHGSIKFTHRNGGDHTDDVLGRWVASEAPLMFKPEDLSVFVVGNHDKYRKFLRDI